MKKILVCGAGGSPATNFVRSLRAMKEGVFLVGIDCDPYTLQRAETDVRILVPKVNEPDYLKVLNQIIEEHGVEFVHAQNDKELEFISTHREDLCAKVFLPDKKTVEICLDKYQTYDRWSAAGIKVPQTVLLENESDLKKAFKSFGPKIWLRNIKGAAGNGSYPTSEYEAALQWIEFQKGWGHFTAAEYLSEQSVTWMSIWNEGDLVVAQGRKRLYWELANRALSGVTGITGTGMTYSDPKFDNLAMRVISAVDPRPHGIFSVDMTYDSAGVPNPTEINIGRFFTTHLFFTQAGLNMPEIFVRLAYGEPLPTLKEKKNPLKNGLLWIRGVDFEPILTTEDEVEASKRDLKKRRAKIAH